MTAVGAKLLEHLRRPKITGPTQLELQHGLLEEAQPTSVGLEVKFIHMPENIFQIQAPELPV